MTRVYYIKKVPIEVRQYFELNFPKQEGFTYEFYWYKKSESGDSKGDNKIYGCNVSKNGEFYHNATQANSKWFKENKDKRSH